MTGIGVTATEHAPSCMVIEALRDSLDNGSPYMDESIGSRDEC